MKISFDFDSTLAEERSQRLAKKLKQEGHELFITTTRYIEPGFTASYHNEPVYVVAEKLGIPRENIRFTNGSEKWRYLEGFDLHFDDDQIEIELLEENLPSCIGVLIFDP